MNWKNLTKLFYSFGWNKKYKFSYFRYFSRIYILNEYFNKNVLLYKINTIIQLIIQFILNKLKKFKFYYLFVFIFWKDSKLLKKFIYSPKKNFFSVYYINIQINSKYFNFQNFCQYIITEMKIFIILKIYKIYK